MVAEAVVAVGAKRPEAVGGGECGWRLQVEAVDGGWKLWLAVGGQARGEIKVEAVDGG